MINKFGSLTNSDFITNIDFIKQSKFYETFDDYEKNKIS